MKCMIDLETLGTTSKAHVLSIGWAMFNYRVVVESGYIAINPDYQGGRERSFSTVAWWIKQAMENPEAAKVWIEGQGIGLVAGLSNLAEVMRIYDVSEVWANSPTFDCAILRDAYQEHGYAAPWEFWKERDFRTLKDLHQKLLQGQCLPKFDGVQHNAEADAIYQAQCVIQIMDLLGPFQPAEAQS